MATLEIGCRKAWRSFSPHAKHINEHSAWYSLHFFRPPISSNYKIIFSFICLACMAKEDTICHFLTELCVAELEDVTRETGIYSPNMSGLGLGLGFSQPIVQESSHPYTDDVTLTGNTCNILTFKGVPYHNSNYKFPYCRSCGSTRSRILARRI